MAGWSICTLIQRKGKEQTIFFNGGTARFGQKITSKNHLNHSEIVELFKIKQVLTEVKIRQLMAGGTRRRQAPCQRNKDFIESKQLHREL